MSERVGGRLRFGRRRAAAQDAVDPPATDAATATAEVPCIPCGQQAGVRAFSLNDVATITDDVVPTLVDGVEFTILGAEVLLFHLELQTSTLLNSSAALVWASVDGETSVATIVDELTTETGTDRATIDRDVRETIARLVAGAIVEIPSADDDRDAAAAGDVGSEDDRAAERDGARREARRSTLVGAALDRITWQPGAGPRWCAGAAVQVRTQSAELDALLTPMLEILPPAEHATVTLSVLERRPDADRRFRIVRDHRTVGWATTPRQAIDMIFTDLNDLAITGSPGRIVLHAGAVARDGSVVVVAGPSGRGKSTLTAALVARGFDYLTDEVVAIDPTSRGVLPYPKPLDVDRVATDLLGLDDAVERPERHKIKVALEHVGAVGSGTGTVRLLVMLADPAATVDASPSAGEAVVELLTNTFASTFAPTGPDRPLDELARLAAEVPILHLGRAPIDELCDVVVRALDATEREAL